MAQLIVGRKDRSESCMCNMKLDGGVTKLTGCLALFTISSSCVKHTQGERSAKECFLFSYSLASAGEVLYHYLAQIKASSIFLLINLRHIFHSLVSYKL